MLVINQICLVRSLCRFSLYLLVWGILLFVRANKLGLDSSGKCVPFPLFCLHVSYIAASLLT